MRKFLFILTVNCLAYGFAFAQNYTKVYDNPDETIKGYLAAEFFGIDFGSKNLKGTMFYTVGLNGVAPISNKIKAEAFIRTPLLRADVSSAGFIFEGGALAQLSSKVNTKEVKIILGYKEEIGFNSRTATIKYVTLPISVKKSFVARGGVYLKKTPFQYDSGDDMITYKTTSIFHKGIYVGIGRVSEYFTHLQTAGRDGEQKKFAAGSYLMPYADIMLLPVSLDAQIETYGLGAGATTKLKGMTGGRVGLKWIRNPFTKSQNEGRKIPFFGNAVIGLEVGSRPLEGFYFGSTVSYVFKKYN